MTDGEIRELVEKAIRDERERLVDRWIACREGEQMQPHEQRFFAWFIFAALCLAVIVILAECWRSQ